MSATVAFSTPAASPAVALLERLTGLISAQIARVEQRLALDDEALLALETQRLLRSLESAVALERRMQSRPDPVPAGAASSAPVTHAFSAAQADEPDEAAPVPEAAVAVPHPVMNFQAFNDADLCRVIVNPAHQEIFRALTPVQRHLFHRFLDLAGPTAARTVPSESAAVAPPFTRDQLPPLVRTISRRLDRLRSR